MATNAAEILVFTAAIAKAKRVTRGTLHAKYKPCSRAVATQPAPRIIRFAKA